MTRETGKSGGRQRRLNKTAYMLLIGKLFRPTQLQTTARFAPLGQQSVK